MKELIEHGYVYIAQPPLYGLKRGKDIHYFFNDSELNQFLEQSDKKWSVQRYKGLGEMDPEQLWETTMNADNRTVMQVTIEEAYQADKVFTDLMGDNVEPRKEFIHDNAKYVTNLDI
ncbi:DNA gyrase subunit B [bioreactor metagenome]|uniref:DNA gyrase subunit B n=1 Tax=bioreactor metagenome TaxID=1076179 RepID=A0A645INB4_9ZZZZ